ncbi:hypothetical protein, partial [Burkholderia sp. Nafp2/4-1b]|uniref:hypothetical protein n=1 Tax=Burkholderia sp. Nafp2/4-1b TaxID=2116686 RepID=UPI001969EC04
VVLAALRHRAVFCKMSMITRGLKINGDAAKGKLDGGKQFDLSGTVFDLQCPLGIETFAGTATFEDVTVQGDGTRHVSIDDVGIHVVGTRSCRTADLVELFTATVDTRVPGPSIGGMLDNDRTGHVVRD